MHRTANGNSDSTAAASSPADAQALDAQEVDAQEVDAQALDAQEVDAQPVDAQELDAHDLDAVLADRPDAVLADRPDAVLADRPDARTDAEVAQDLAFLDVDQLAEAAGPLPDDSLDVVVNGDGELESVRTAPAGDRAQLDDDQAFEIGQNWVESLQTQAAEEGPAPEQEVDMLDDDDEDTRPHRTGAKDVPVADLGSAGPRGL